MAQSSILERSVVSEGKPRSERRGAARAPEPAGRGGDAGLGDQRFLGTLQRVGGWLSAVQVAAAHRMSWYSVAFALRRLAEQHLVEEDVVAIEGKQRSKESSRVYRARPAPGEHRRVSDLPAWLAPQAVVSMGVPEMIDGSCSMRRWNDEDRPRVNLGRRRTDGEGRETATRTRAYPATLAWRAAKVLWMAYSEPKKMPAVAG